MVKDFIGEKWKEIQFDFDFINDYRLFISNFGRVKSFNKNSNGNIVKGTMINGYRIIRLKFYKQRDPKVQEQLNNIKKQVFKLAAKLKQQIAEKQSKKTIHETSLLLELLKKNLHKKFIADTKKRTINYHALVHRLVAQYFLPNPKQDATVVAHINFDKLNNHVANLKWMAREENFAHQQKSPLVIKQKQQRKLGLGPHTKVSKLTITKVMLLKKLLNQNKPVRQLVKQFKVSDMQIYRIKRGENWGHIEAAN